MTPMPGTKLLEVWASMDQSHKDSMIRDYKTILQSLRNLPPPIDAYIGAVDGGPAIDHRSCGIQSGGAFKTDLELNHWLLSLAHPDSALLCQDFYTETIEGSMRDDHTLVFPYGDIGIHNVLVENGRITAIIDWEFAGWYPEYWDYVKMIQFVSYRNKDSGAMPNSYGESFPTMRSTLLTEPLILKSCMGNDSLAGHARTMIVLSPKLIPQSLKRILGIFLPFPPPAESSCWQ
ncbi:MAG: hypothetical protein M1825_000343 [Sarcosagium campestre]|nr:MAG: hypothetical protein M1825_000343 [Sarcosagium campestre]